MKYFGLAALALAMTVGASADTITQTCLSFNVVGGSGGNVGFSCNSFGALDGGGTVTNAFIVYNSDYSNGTAPNVQTQTIFTFAGGGLFYAGDTLTSIGTGNSNPAVSSDPNAGGFHVFNAGPPVVLAGFYDNASLLDNGQIISGTWNNSTTQGSALANTGYVELVLTYTPNAVPEPGSMMLLGGGLVAFAIAGRKLVRK